MALLAMGASNVAQAHFAGGKWSIATVTTQSGAAPPAEPALVAFGGGYLASWVAGGTGAPLESNAYTGSWSAPSRVGALTAQGTPALAVAGATAHVVFWGGDGKYYHGTYGSAWDTASDPLAAGSGPQSFGSSGPAAVAAGSSIVAVQAGTNGILYDQIWSGGAWQAATAHAGTSLVPTLTPAIVALQGSSADLLVVYVRAGDANDYHLEYTTRTGTTWSPPAEVFDLPGMIAFTGSTPSLAPLPSGGAVVVWQGYSPASPWASVYTAGTGWTAPAPITPVLDGGGFALASAPVVSPGVCGAAAVAAFVQSSGQVYVSSLEAGSWSAVTPITGAMGMQSVAIASTP